MIRNYCKCPECKSLTVIVVTLTEMDNKATHSLVCTNCGTETQISMIIIETIKG